MGCVFGCWFNNLIDTFTMYCRIRCRRVAVVVLSCAASFFASFSTASAQTPPSVGSAAGWGLGGMTEARFGESVLWNPALVALPDVSTSSLGFLQFDGIAELRSDTPPGFVSPSWDVLRRKESEAGFVNDLLASEDLPPIFGGRIRGSVVWLSGHMEEFGFLATSTIYGDFSLPVRALHILNGSISGTPMLDDLIVAESYPSDYGAYTTLALARSEYIGRVGILGHLWVGAGIKYSFIHRVARGRVRYGEADEIAQSLPFEIANAPLVDPHAYAFVYDIWEVSGGRALGGDVGILSNPFGQLLVSVSLSNVYQSTSFEPNNIAFSQFWSLGRENGYESMKWESRTQDIVLPEGVEQYLFELVGDMHFPRMLRAGVALDVRSFRLVGGYAFPIEGGRAIGRDWSSELGGSIAYVGRFSPRISYERRLDGANVYSLGAQFGTCGRVVRTGFSYVDGEARGVGMTIAVTFGAPPCGWN